MKTLYKFTYNIICDHAHVTPYDCEEVGAAYESVHSGRRFSKNSLNSLKKIEGGYEMVGESYEQGMMLFTQKIINTMADSIEQYNQRVAECQFIREKVKVRQGMLLGDLGDGGQHV